MGSTIHSSIKTLDARILLHTKSEVRAIEYNSSAK
jgi:hypothetical protein